MNMRSMYLVNNNLKLGGNINTVFRPKDGI